MASRLSVYNGALRLCGERRLSSEAEERKSRRLLDDVWDDNGIRRCLEAGQWRFAIRTEALAGSTDFEAPFGYAYQFEKPDDLIRVVGVFPDGSPDAVPLTRYIDEGSFWYADVVLYVRFVSDDDQFGMNIGEWPHSFSEYVEAYFASRVVIDITQDDNKRAAVLHPKTGILARALLTAKSNDAMKDPAKFAPTGTWVNSRGAGRRRNNDPSGSRL